ncbi:MAG: AbrB/MazE/SpoVT family DNA-binding domain-containing protein [Acidithiobacillus sp.]
MNHSYTVHIDRRGRIVLPSGLRRQLGIEQDQTLILELQAEGGIRLLSQKQLARGGRGLLRDMAPAAEKQRVLSEELIAERRSMAARE